MTAVRNRLVLRPHLLFGSAIYLFSAAPTAFAAAYVVRESAAQVAMPNAIPVGDRVFRKGEAIVDVPLLWRQAIKLNANLELVVDGKTEIISANTFLPLHIVGDEKQPSQRSVAFCTPRKAVENKTEKGVLGVLLGGGSLWRGIIRGATDRQLCLFDKDNDGNLDSWVLIGDGSSEARVPNEMPSISYVILRDVPISEKDRYQVYFYGASRSGKWADFQFDIMQQGETRKFDTMTTPSGVFYHLDRRKRPTSGWPLTTKIAGFDAVIVAVEEKGKGIRITASSTADPNFQVQIPEMYRVTVRYY